MGTGGFQGRILLLGCFLIYSVGTAAKPAEALRTSPSRGCLAAIAAVALLTVGYLSPNIYHDVSGAVTGQRHIGYGIHLDWPNLINNLTAEERELVKNPEANAVAIVSLFSRKLSASYDERLEDSVSWFPRTQYASEFVAKNGEASAICRHQARLLAAFLNEIGIKAEIWQGYDPSSELWHAWVQVPSLGIVADPNLGEPLSINEYHSNFTYTQRLSFRKQWVSSVLY